jgi:hypothetical protein
MAQIAGCGLRVAGCELRIEMDTQHALHSSQPGWTGCVISEPHGGGIKVQQQFSVLSIDNNREYLIVEKYFDIIS